MKGDGGIVGRHEDVRLNKIKILELSKILKEAGIVPGEQVVLVGDGSGLINVNNFTNLTPMPEAVGGHEAGSTFNNVLITDVINNLLYPYQYPSFTSFELNNFQAVRYEVGTEISNSQSFIWSTNNSSNIDANSISISGKFIPTTSGLANDGAEVLTFTNTLTRGTAGTESWTITATNSKNQTFVRSNHIRWDFLMYYGSSTQTSLTEAQIQSLQNKSLTAGNNGATGQFTFNAIGYKYFVIADDAAYTKPSSFVDVDTGFALGMYSGFSNTDNGYSYDLVSVTNSFNITQAYRVYRTQNQLAAAININIT